MNYLRKQNEKNKYHPSLNCMIVIAVLTGLFFSSAEGVRLLPFPDFETSRVNAGEPGGSRIFGSRYAPAIQSSNAKYSAAVKAKQNNRADAAPAAVPAQLIAVPKWSAVPLQVSSNGSWYAHSCIADQQTSRGPPSV